MDQLAILANLDAMLSYADAILDVARDAAAHASPPPSRRRITSRVWFRARARRRRRKTAQCEHGRRASFICVRVFLLPTRTRLRFLLLTRIKKVAFDDAAAESRTLLWRIESCVLLVCVNKRLSPALYAECIEHALQSRSLISQVVAFTEGD